MAGITRTHAQMATSDLPEFRKTCSVGNRSLRYKLIIKPHTNEYRGEIRVANRLLSKVHKYHTVPIQWEAGLNTGSNELRQAGDIQITIVPNAKQHGDKVKNNFHIRITRLPSTLPDQPTAAFTPEVLLDRKLHYIFFESSQDLVTAYIRNPKNEILNELITDMVDAFTNNNGRANVITEMVALIPILQDEDSFLVISSLIHEIHKNPIHNRNTLNGLVHILRTYQRSTYQELVSQLKNDQIGTPSQVLDPDTLVNIAQVLLSGINGCTTAQSRTNSEPMHVVYLKAFVAVLEVMEMTGLTQLERRDYHTPFYKLLLKYDYAADLKEAYLAALGKQILAQIPDDETKLHAFLRHCYYFGNTCLLLYKAYSDKSLSALGEAGKSFLKTFQMQEGEADWYVTLFSIEYALKTQGIQFLKALKYLVQWAEVGHHEAKKLIERLHTHNPFFIYGLIQAFQKFIDSQAGLHPEAYWLAFFFLEKIGKDNGTNEGTFTVEITFKRKMERLCKQKLPDYVTRGATEIGESYSKQVHQEIIELLKHYACHHSVTSIRALAQKVYNQFSTEKLASYTPIAVPGNFLHSAVLRKTPWAAAFRTEYRSIADDEQLEQEERYYIQLEVKNQLNGNIKDLHALLSEFQKSSDRVLLFTGPAGSGKSFSIKHFVKQSWEKGLQDGFIPMVVSLGTLKDRTKAVTEKLAKRGLNINDIQQLPILWIFDGEDETKEAASTTQRLYTLMELNLWTNSKAVFIARSGMSDAKIASFSPKEGSRDGLLHCEARPFDKTKRDQYFTQFSNIRKLENEKEKTTTTAQSSTYNWGNPNTYIQFLDSNNTLSDLMATPLYLSLTAKVLPLIIERRIKESSNQNATFVKTDLLDAFYCSTVGREIRKRKAANAGWKEQGAKTAYLKFATEVVKCIKKYEHEAKPDMENPWMPKEVAESQYPQFFNENDDDLVMKRRCCSLTLKEGGYSYSHRTFYDYFFALGGDPARTREVKDLLKDDSYQHTF